MRNTLLRSLTLATVLTLLVLSLAACTQNAPSTPPTREGEPILSISGSATSSSDEGNSSNTSAMSNESDTDSSGQEPTTPRPSSNSPTRTVKEGQLISFENLKAEDPDGDEVTFTFNEPLDRNGRWQTKRGDAGEYLTTITASDGKSSTTQELLIIVESVNAAPTLSVSDVSVNEGETITLTPAINDTDGDDVSVSFSGWMTSASKATTSADIGTHTVTVTASDGFESVRKDINVIVNDVNHAPELAPIDDVTITEGETVRVIASANDPDGDSITYSYGEPLDERGQWKTAPGDEGQYSIRVSASDGDNTDTQDFEVTVLHKNEAPQLTLEKTSISVNEGDTVRIEYRTSDAENNDVNVTFSGWMESATYTTTYEDAGEYTVTVTASDGQDETSRTVSITVKDQNRPPVFDTDSFN